MPITRERQSDYSGWETGGRGDPRSRKRSNARLRNFYRKYVKSGKINDLAGAKSPIFLALHVI